MGKKGKTLLTAAALIVLIGAAAAAYHMLQAGTELPRWQQAAGTEENSGEETGAAMQEKEEAGEGTAAREETEGEESQRLEAFDFTVYDGEGQAVSLSDFKGKIVLMNFWATWCGYCVSEMPDFQRIYEEYGDQIQVMMINATDGVSETQEEAAAYIAEQGHTFPVFYDLQYDACYQYGVSALPMTFIIGADGYIEGYARGAVNYEVLKNALDPMLEGA